MISSDLFGGFDPALLARIQAGNVAHKAEQARARAVRTSNRHAVRRAKAESELATLLPERIEDGDSWHVISHGNIDALSYLRHLLKPTYFDYVGVSTWCIARQDLTEISAWLDAGRIDHFALYAGEIFRNQYGDEYEMVQRMRDDYGVHFVMAKNHSKVTLCANHAEDYYVVVESSANVNTNPRIEQACVTRSRELFEFYREFFDGLKSIDREGEAARAANVIAFPRAPAPAPVEGD